ncbi:MAG: PAS domain S-box protein [Planctomycetaceae bacterium]|nr:PAS domain S-box protein [Planctomycetaceae bacterium]
MDRQESLDDSPGFPGPWTRAILICLAWQSLIAGAILRLEKSDGALLAMLSLVPVALTLAICARAGRGLGKRATSDEDPRTRLGPLPDDSSLETAVADAVPKSPLADARTRSGLYDTPPAVSSGSNRAPIAADVLNVEMVSRLEPSRFYWIESSPAEQQFLGRSLDELRQRSFLDVIVADDRTRAEEALRQALSKGEFLGLVVRVRTAAGKTKAIEVNSSTRYGSDQTVSHLRCHITDVTEKVRSERELRLRSRELTQLNQQLREINRELEQLKNRYTDLYENSPAMYFSLNEQGILTECNQTFLTTLDRSKEDLVGQSFDAFVDPSEIGHCRHLFEQLLKTGSIDAESRWVRTGGELIDVLISGRVIRGPRGNFEQTRCVAQDLTAKHRLEAELRSTNQSLARAVAELSEKNRELDEFVYVVSHDLQEPLRTLSAFSDFLLQDHSEQLDSKGYEYVQRLVAASKRMRSMISGLMVLSRAGKVTGEFAEVDLGELVAEVQSDLSELIRSRGAEARLIGPSVLLWGDHRRYQQLLANLVGNGIKYNRSSRPLVEIGIRDGQSKRHSASATDADFCTLFVRDNGIGIDPRHHDRIFQLFRRLYAQDEFEGTGAGLAICRKIALAHRGDIWVESRPGAGATFLVRLPRPPVTAAHQIVSQAASPSRAPEG